eukprot:CAMPEP_0194284704 /NCGR_PEP_ID=MMETSP0169-20130528/28372_1 /TAXON_ID=218684 /ORGANISM="Corethron pennatum, Strain L29A3" /LENGTH=308 /DNA_ID=CAMNT_0039030607 /DNA_START=81 /DNA_END=1003 /DNA_ORIENTATION=-
MTNENGAEVPGATTATTQDGEGDTTMDDMNENSPTTMAVSEDTAEEIETVPADGSAEDADEVDDNDLFGSDDDDDYVGGAKEIVKVGNGLTPDTAPDTSAEAVVSADAASSTALPISAAASQDAFVDEEMEEEAEMAATASEPFPATGDDDATLPGPPSFRPILPSALPLSDSDGDAEGGTLPPLQSTVERLLGDSPDPRARGGAGSARLAAALTRCAVRASVPIAGSKGCVATLACNGADTVEGHLTGALLGEASRRGQRRGDASAVGPGECYGLVLAAYGRCGRIWCDALRWMAGEVASGGEDVGG